VLGSGLSDEGCGLWLWVADSTHAFCDHVYPCDLSRLCEADSENSGRGLAEAIEM